MPENCNENACVGLEGLRQQMDDLRKQNGADHKDFRERMIKIEMEEARQKERFDRIMDTLGEVRTDNKNILSSVSSMSYKVESLESLSEEVDGIKEKLAPITHKIGAVDKLSSEVGDIKEKPAKRWDDMVKQVIGLAVAALVGIVIARLGL